MNDKALLSTIIATISAAGSFILVNVLRGKPVDWISALTFIIVFAVVFSLVRTIMQRTGR